MIEQGKENTIKWYEGKFERRKRKNNSENNHEKNSRDETGSKKHYFFFGTLRAGLSLVSAGTSNRSSR